MTHRLIVLYKCIKFHWNFSYGYQVIEWTRNCMENNQREITPKIWKQEYWFLCMTHRLIMLYKCTMFHWKISNVFLVIEQTQNCMKNNQRKITPKMCKQGLWFFSTTHYLIVLYKCTKFHWNIFYGFRVIERTRNCIKNNQRKITHKILKPALWFLGMTHCLIMLNKCTKFYWKNWNGFQVIERTRNCIENNQREITPKNTQARVMVLVHDTSSRRGLQVYQVLLKNL